MFMFLEYEILIFILNGKFNFKYISLVKVFNLIVKGRNL